MHAYIIKVKANLPYPIEKEYRIVSWHLWTAISRALKQFRAEPKLTRKRLGEVTIKGIQLEGSVVVDKELPEEPEEDYSEQELSDEERKRIEDNIARNTVVLSEGKGGE